MNVMVTGGAGYLGSHLTSRLIAAHHHVRILDRFSKNQHEYVWLKEHADQIDCIPVDIANTSYLKPEYFDDIDWVFHCAGMSPCPDMESMHDEYFQANLMGTIRVLQGAKKSGVTRFLYPMTTTIYSGANVSVPTDETAPITFPSIYTLSKYLGEQAVLSWGRMYGLGVVSLRIFSLYGPDSPVAAFRQSVIAKMLAHKKEGKPFLLDGDGTQTRDFIYIDDVCDAFLLCAASSQLGEILHVGTGKQTSLMDLATLLDVPFTLSGRSSPAPLINQADIRKIKKILGWKPKMTLQQGLTRMQ